MWLVVAIVVAMILAIGAGIAAARRLPPPATAAQRRGSGDSDPVVSIAVVPILVGSPPPDWGSYPQLRGSRRDYRMSQLVAVLGQPTIAPDGAVTFVRKHRGAATGGYGSPIVRRTITCTRRPLGGYTFQNADKLEVSAAPGVTAFVRDAIQTGVPLAAGAVGTVLGGPAAGAAAGSAAGILVSGA